MAPPARKPTSGVWIRDVGNAMTHSVELLVGLMFGIGLGLLAQRQWPGIEPWGIIVGFLFGLGAVIRSIQRMIAESVPHADTHPPERQP